MEKEFYKIGEIIDSEKKIAVVGELGQGYGFKDEEAFTTKKGICYIPEHAFLDISSGKPYECDECEEGQMKFDEGFDYNDFLELAKYLKENIDTSEKYSLEDIALGIFQTVDWQFPSTLVDEWIGDGDVFVD